MDIGQMIEFLTKDNQTLRIEKWGTEEWTLGEIYNSEEYKNEHKGELCDALWEAVKEVLE